MKKTFESSDARECAFCRTELPYQEECFLLGHKQEGTTPEAVMARFCSAAHLLRYVMNEVVANFVTNGMEPGTARRVVAEQLSKDVLLN